MGKSKVENFRIPFICHSLKKTELVTKVGEKVNWVSGYTEVSLPFRSLDRLECVNLFDQMCQLVQSWCVG